MRHVLPPACRPPRAFTLIELLVVVAIIALLMAILMPSLGSARDQARRVYCGNNVYRLGQGLLTYLNSDGDNQYPTNGILFPKGNMNDIPTMYMSEPRFKDTADTDLQHCKPEYGELWRWVGGQVQDKATGAPSVFDAKLGKVYLCPSDDLIRSNAAALILDRNRTVSRNVAGGPASSGYWSYSVNTVLNSLGRFRNNFTAKGLPWMDPVKHTSIVNPTQFIVWVEEDAQVSSFNDEVFEPPAYRDAQQANSNSPTSNDSMLTGRHNHGGNVGFGDGHVEWMGELIFNQGPSAGTGGVPDNWTAMQHPVTRMFFPDFGAFATPP